jgi:hypothetical protein
MTTIENINTCIIIKITNLQKILSIYSKYDFTQYENSLIASYNNELKDMLLNYECGTLDILKEYNEQTTASNKTIYYNKFISFINMENIQSKLKRMISTCMLIRRTYTVTSSELTDAFCKYEEVPLDIKVVSKVQVPCACGYSSTIEAKTSEMICKCGAVEKLLGVVFEDDQFFYQEGQRIKHGKYDPTKHCKFWVDRIQAKENTEIPDDLIKSIKRLILRDKIWHESLTCADVRMYLKELKKTKFNDHVPLIRKIITNIDPEQLTDHELKLVYMYFNLVMQIFNKTKTEDISNSPYHPFFVYKIIEQILKKPEERVRKCNILSCIHLQAPGTLINHDLIWAPICAQIPEFVYIPTKPS